MYYSNHEFGVYDDRVNLYLIISYDEGETFSTPILLSEQEFNSSYANWRSDYIRIGIDYGIAYPAWTDFRDGNPTNDNSNIYSNIVMVKPSAPQNLQITASPNNHPLLTWDPNPEPDLSHYQVWRKITGWDNKFVLLETTTNTSYEDDIVLIIHKFGTRIYYKVKAVDNTNYVSDFSNFVSVDGTAGLPAPMSSRLHIVPNTISLFSNYPNPFNPETVIQFALPESEYITLKIFSTTGEEVATLIDKYVEKGYFNVKWDGNDQSGNLVSSGLYFYVLRSANKQITRKMLLLR